MAAQRFPATTPAVAAEVLVELCLENFEPAFSRLGIGSLEQLAQVRYEELLEMGLSKVQCHLFIAKVSSLAGAGAAAAGSGEGAVLGTRILSVVDVRDTALAEELANHAQAEEQRGTPSVFDDTSDMGMGQPAHASQRQSTHVRRAALRQHMPPPVFIGSPAPEAPHGRKRAHSSHLSTAAARGGSSHRSTAERACSSASGSSSSSLHQEVRVKKRRVLHSVTSYRSACGGQHGGGTTLLEDLAGCPVDDVMLEPDLCAEHSMPAM